MSQLSNSLKIENMKRQSGQITTVLTLIALGVMTVGVFFAKKAVETPTSPFYSGALEQCSCSSWVDGDCGGWECLPDQRHRFQACSPPECDGNPDNQCISDDSCPSVECEASGDCQTGEICCNNNCVDPFVCSSYPLNDRELQEFEDDCLDQSTAECLVNDTDCDGIITRDDVEYIADNCINIGTTPTSTPTSTPGATATISGHLSIINPGSQAILDAIVYACNLKANEAEWDCNAFQRTFSITGASEGDYPYFFDNLENGKKYAISAIACLESHVCYDNLGSVVCPDQQASGQSSVCKVIAPGTQNLKAEIPTPTVTPTGTIATPTPSPTPTATLTPIPEDCQTGCRNSTNYGPGVDTPEYNWCALGTKCKTDWLDEPTVSVSCPLNKIYTNTGKFCTRDDGKKMFDGTQAVDGYETHGTSSCTSIPCQGCYYESTVTVKNTNDNDVTVNWTDDKGRTGTIVGSYTYRNEQHPQSELRNAWVEIEIPQGYEIQSSFCTPSIKDGFPGDNSRGTMLDCNVVDNKASMRVFCGAVINYGWVLKTTDTVPSLDWAFNGVWQDPPNETWCAVQTWFTSNAEHFRVEIWPEQNRWFGDIDRHLIRDFTKDDIENGRVDHSRRDDQGRYNVQFLDAIMMPDYDEFWQAKVTAFSENDIYQPTIQKQWGNHPGCQGNNTEGEPPCNCLSHGWTCTENCWDDSYETPEHYCFDCPGYYNFHFYCCPPAPGASPTPTPTPTPQICSQPGADCIDEYPQKCCTNGSTDPSCLVNGDGTQICHKEGTCQGVGGGDKCSWGPGSYCGPCVAQGPAPTPAPPPTDRCLSQTELNYQYGGVIPYGFCTSASGKYCPPGYVLQGDDGCNYTCSGGSPGEWQKDPGCAPFGEPTPTPILPPPPATTACIGGSYIITNFQDALSNSGLKMVIHDITYDFEGPAQSGNFTFNYPHELLGTDRYLFFKLARTDSDKSYVLDVRHMIIGQSCNELFEIELPIEFTNLSSCQDIGGDNCSGQCTGGDEVCLGQFGLCCQYDLTQTCGKQIKGSYIVENFPPGLRDIPLEMRVRGDTMIDTHIGDPESDTFTLTSTKNSGYKDYLHFVFAVPGTDKTLMVGYETGVVGSCDDQFKITLQGNLATAASCRQGVPNVDCASQCNPGEECIDLLDICCFSEETTCPTNNEISGDLIWNNGPEVGFKYNAVLPEIPGAVQTSTSPRVEYNWTNIETGIPWRLIAPVYKKHIFQGGEVWSPYQESFVDWFTLPPPHCNLSYPLEFLPPPEDCEGVNCPAVLDYANHICDTYQICQNVREAIFECGILFVQCCGTGGCPMTIMPEEDYIAIHEFLHIWQGRMNGVPNPTAFVHEVADYFCHHPEASTDVLRTYIGSEECKKDFCNFSDECAQQTNWIEVHAHIGDDYAGGGSDILSTLWDYYDGFFCGNAPAVSAQKEEAMTTKKGREEMNILKQMYRGNGVFKASINPPPSFTLLDKAEKGNLVPDENSAVALGNVYSLVELTYGTQRTNGKYPYYEKVEQDVVVKATAPDGTSVETKTGFDGSYILKIPVEKQGQEFTFSFTYSSGEKIYPDIKAVIYPGLYYNISAPNGLAERMEVDHSKIDIPVIYFPIVLEKGWNQVNLPSQLVKNQTLNSLVSQIKNQGIKTLQVSVFKDNEWKRITYELDKKEIEFDPQKPITIYSEKEKTIYLNSLVRPAGAYCARDPDLDQNEVVNARDYSLLLAKYGLTEADLGDLKLGDINCDRKVDALDLSIVIPLIGQEKGP